MGKRRKRRHPGVVLVKPVPARERTDPKTGEVSRSGVTGWRVRFADPDSGKTKWETIPKKRANNRDNREEFAIEKSKEIADRQRELDAGAARDTDLSLAATIERYFDAHPKLRPATVELYREATGKLTAWSRRTRIETADELTRAKLIRFRETLVKQDRSPHTINRQLRSTKTVLTYLVDADALARLSQDDLRRALKQLRAPTEKRDFLRPKQLQRLLEACQRHDTETFKITRAEHDGERKTGSTRRYEAISGFTLFTLLSGCRLGEALALDWKHVDLEALGGGGEKVGEIYIGSASKTGKPRTIGIEVSPALRRLLIAQKLRTGGRGLVWGLTQNVAKRAMPRLVEKYGAPEAASFQALRRTCSTFLCNTPGIFGGASAYRSAQQLGHSVAVAERNYSGLLRGISPEAHTLEAAMQIEKQADAIIGRLSKAMAA